MKILAFSSIYPSPARPTAGPYNREAFVALSRYSEVRVISPLPAWQLLSRPRDIVLPVRESKTGLDTIYSPYFSVPGMLFLHAGGMVASLARTMAAVREAFPWDAVLASWIYPDATAAAVFAQRWKTPLVTMALGSDLNVAPGSPGVAPQVRWTLSRSAHVVTVSRALGDRAVELGARPDSVVVQHNAVDGEAFVIRDRAEMRRRLGLDPDRPTIGYFGYHRHIKGTDILVEAMDHLVRRLGRSDVLLALVGQGDTTEQIRALVTKLGLDSNIRFFGNKPHAEIPEWMGAIDLFCLPSRQEGCPNVVLESLASGRPVVATRVGGVPEILNDETGIIVPPEQPAALAEALRSALGRKWDPESLRASVEFLSWDAVGRRYADMFRSLVG